MNNLNDDGNPTQPRENKVGANLNTAGVLPLQQIFIFIFLTEKYVPKNMDFVAKTLLGRIWSIPSSVLVIPS